MRNMPEKHSWRRVTEFKKEHGKTDEPDSLGAVEFSSLDYDVVQDYEADTEKNGEKSVVRNSSGKKNKTEFVMTRRKSPPSCIMRKKCL